MQIDMTALRLVEAEKGMDFESLVATVEEALLKAYRNQSGVKAPARVEVDRKTGEVKVWVTELDEEGNALGDVEVTPEDFGRTAAATVKSVIIQRFQEEEDKQVLGDFKERIGQVVSGVVVAARDPKFIAVDLGDIEGVIPPAEQAPGEHFRDGERIRVYVLSAARGMKGPHIELSRTHPGLVQGLFNREVPEIEKGLVVIESVAREPGHRTKIAVRALEKGMNPKGACIGPNGSRVRAVMNELNGEKIDIIDWSDNPVEFIANALSPAKVVSVRVLDEDRRLARVVVPDFQQSLAIGKEGQNARLASRLTGWGIDIHSDSEVGATSA
ncbi:transcription termination factor NusA [Mobiluncus mulieris]|uniref:Transcription termination/antitermination protein NusA n=2 Tax=Mobiluncus mulieris TaxID=2052 RepID=E0QSP6_9ACTO|nr:transcription termination factor NusA [Mobiluncus mulieris]EEJ53773.1 transcription termination factor NusA [Mobiluncus mulieris ATCC 35243]EEZ90956.1 transcription termination factor NusA [Mobiluncus mulieris 28-1]EFM45410.1 transcription termination factor NusA [Mobiluncus mulieris ATCC 35239]EFN94017.1 transcription termination factor NusA [Mobiluncus mulieris FB024-16]MBB5845681.1 N utilization substance protein A [Mobiluncus mulieris]